MNSKAVGLASAVLALMLTESVAQAAVIPGPLLSIDGNAWVDTGIGFTANTNAALTSFTFQNQGAADTIVLTDSLGNILQSISTPSSTPSYTANVNWALTSGHEYFLLQTTASNEFYAIYGLALPSDSDITVDISGTFDNTIAGAVADSQGWGTDTYWAAFNNITTGGTTSAVPEPVTVTLFGAGLVGVAGLRRRKKKTA